MKILKFLSLETLGVKKIHKIIWRKVNGILKVLIGVYN